MVSYTGMTAGTISRMSEWTLPGIKDGLEYRNTRIRQSVKQTTGPIINQ